MSNIVVILEGPDGSGKTTLANELATRLNGLIMHEGPPPESAGSILFHYYRKLSSAVHIGTKPVIFDRLYLGEHVYGPVSRDSDKLLKFGVGQLCNLCERNKVVQLICLPPYEVALDNYREKIKDKDDYLKSERAWHEVYYRYAGLCLPPFIKYDYTESSYDDVYRLILSAHGQSGGV